MMWVIQAAAYKNLSKTYHVLQKIYEVFWKLHSRLPSSVVKLCFFGNQAMVNFLYLDNLCLL